MIYYLCTICDKQFRSVNYMSKKYAHFLHKRQDCTGHKENDTQCQRCKSWFAQIKRHKCRSSKCIACDTQVPNLKLHIARKHKNLKHIKETTLFPDTIAAIISGYSPNPKMVNMCTGCGLIMNKPHHIHHGCPKETKLVKMDVNDQPIYRQKRIQQFRQLEQIIV